MLNTGFAAESANITTLDPVFDGMPILLERADRELTTVMSNGFGFGGTNGSLIMARV
jgi:3-oxoacyl-[acyl-carrier-protein] synthase-1